MVFANKFNKHKYLVKVRPFLAAKAVDLFDYNKTNSNRL